jgi:hypothetical protein
MAYQNRGEGFPANAMIASFVLDVLEQRGVLHRSGFVETIRNISDRIPPHLVGDQRVASLTALRALLDDPHAHRVTLREWFKS